MDNMPKQHCVSAGSVSWRFDVSQPSVTLKKADPPEPPPDWWDRARFVAMHVVGWILRIPKLVDILNSPAYRRFAPKAPT